MKRTLLMMFLALLLVISGCSSNQVHDGVNARKAAQANADLGLRYLMQGNNEVAMEKLKRALEYDPDHVAAHHYLAELYRRLERYEDADDHFRHALRYADGDASSLHNNYGGFLCSQGRYEDGVEEFEEVLDNPVYPRRDLVYENIGICLEGKGDEGERAGEYLRKSLQLNPRSPKSLLAMARLSYANKNYLSARGYLQRYAGVAHHSAESLWLGIRIERKLGDKNALASYGISLRGKFPDAPETKLYLQSQ